MTFPYFGQKQAILKYYQEPVCDLIVEPFYGSAKYAARYGLTRDVHINDTYKVIYGIWKWIQGATRSDVYNLPKLTKPGQSLNDIKSLSDPERWLLGFATGVGRAQPSAKITNFAAHRQGTVQLRRDLLKLVDGKISHWKITNIDYSLLPDYKEATWFIDPPYQYFGKHYKHNEKKIDFKKLGKWCKSRSGQVIVCEAGAADWLPFKPLIQDKKLKRLQRDDEYIETVYHQCNKLIGLGL